MTPRRYRRTEILEGVPWSPDMDMSRVLVLPEQRPEPGGYVMWRPGRPRERFYVSPEWFRVAFTPESS